MDEIYMTDIHEYLKDFDTHLEHPLFNGQQYETMGEKTYSNGEKVKVVDITKPTKEFSSFLKDLEMPSDYSHVTDAPAHDYVNSVSVMLDDKWVMSHSALTDDFLAHHGIKGQKWGIRRFQTSNGTWTPEGLARRRNEIVGTAKKATETISTAVRKTFNPTSADMDEKIAKAKEKAAVARKKQEIRQLKGKNKDLKYMSDQEVQNEIESRKQRRYLDQMRKQDSSMEQGKKFALNMAKKSTVPLKVLGDAIGDTAEYGLRKAGEALVDHVVDSAKWKADKEYKRKYEDEHKSEKDKLREKRELAEAKANLENQKLANEVQQARYKSDKSRLEREASENYFQRTVLDSDDTGSAKAAERLQTLKDVRSNPNGGGKKNGKNNDNKNNDNKNNDRNHEQQNRKENRDRQQNQDRNQNRNRNRRYDK